jgi:hypothetical protein
MRILSIYAATLAQFGLIGAAMATSQPLPTYGHFHGFGQVTATNCNVGRGVGTVFHGEFETHTPSGLVVENAHLIWETNNAPLVIKYHFLMSGGTAASQTGTVDISYNGVASGTAPYSATITPYDPNSFQASFTFDFPATGNTAACTETDVIAFVRSSGY